MSNKKLKDIIVFPVSVYIKYNGFLGIVSWDRKNDKLFVASKTTNKGDYRNWFYDILKESVDLGLLSDFLKINNVSLVFEVIDPMNDPHIIEYKDKNIVLLDAIYNEWEFKRYSDLEYIFKSFGFKQKELAFEFYNFGELSDFVHKTKRYDFKHNSKMVEGFVVEDSNGYMFKLKTKAYSFWKNMRGVKESLAKGRVVNTGRFNTPEENYFYKFLMGKDKKYLESKSIIELRKEYFKMKECDW